MRKPMFWNQFERTPKKTCRHFAAGTDIP